MRSNRSRGFISAIVGAVMVLAGLTVVGVTSTAMAAGTWSQWASTLRGSSGLFAVRAKAVVVDPNTGNVYVGGEQLRASNQPDGSAQVDSRNVVMWNASTSQWQALKFGTASASDFVNVMIWHGGMLYVAGAFSAMQNANGTNVPNTANIARWNPNTSLWESVGTGGPSGEVRSLTFDASDNLYAGTAAAGSLWKLSNGTSTWAAVSPRIEGAVNALLVDGGRLYVGGSFRDIYINPTQYRGITGVPDSNYIASCDVATCSTNAATWSAASTGLDSTVNALASYSSTVMAGGAFTGGLSSWNGTTWSVPPGSPGATVNALTANGSTLYAGGSLTSGDSRRLTSWNGSTWTPLGYGVNSIVYGIAVTTNAVIPVGELLGYYTASSPSATSTASEYIASWAPPASAPGAPTGVSATAGDATAAVTWTAPASNGGATITSYTVTSSPAGGTCTVNGSPAATSCTVTGLTNGTAYTFTVTATNSAGTGSASSASSAVTPATSGGGGGGGGGSSTPTPTPAPSTTATPAPTQPAAPLGPILVPNDSAAGASNGTVAEGGAVLLVDGRQTAMTVSPDALVNPTGLNLTSSGFTMWIAGRGDINDPLGLTPKSALILQSEQGTATRAKKITPYAELRGTGFRPGSDIQVWMLPQTLVGTVQVDAKGDFSSNVDIPRLLSLGANTLQANGYTPDGIVRSVSLGIDVIARQLGAKHSTAITYFAAGSSRLTLQAQRSLTQLARSIPKSAKGVRVNVTGFVQPTSYSGNDKSLSTARARAVSQYLRTRGLSGTYTVSGKGKALQRGPSARRVVSVVAYWKANA